ncbi:MAG: plasmid stabilization protein [Candidatus Muproteobacteria bacterium RBG_16_65_34]|uniref:Plasmid stabilization protein n=1 Tax=Candidatus Muproteobacteria bacterium RBG_16_65_34 TaxID=1817760 RepID=A0A1F6TM77_9PROT|nr:MAG: plasmid stabilization protein [Candidatus Muproteobacteria bacterium RBG_16_65_34]
MAQTLIWSQEALDDIDSIAEYISRDSLYHAQQVVEHIVDLGESLPAQPKLGRVVPELNNPEVRERFIYSYRLIYELKNDAIHILAVIHGKRLLESVERFTP